MNEPAAADREKASPIWAAQHVRMLTEHQQHSTENQVEIISLYAAHADSGLSEPMEMRAALLAVSGH